MGSFILCKAPFFANATLMIQHAHTHNMYIIYITCMQIVADAAAITFTSRAELISPLGVPSNVNPLSRLSKKIPELGLV